MQKCWFYLDGSEFDSGFFSVLDTFRFAAAMQKYWFSYAGMDLTVGVFLFRACQVAQPRCKSKGFYLYGDRFNSGGFLF